MGTPKTRKMRTRVCAKCGKTETIRADNASSTCRSCATKIQNAENRVGKRNHKHGWTGTPTYATWRQIIHRCTNKNNKEYAQYGGRGIKVCKRWLKFPAFLEDMGMKPYMSSIHRRNNDEGYYPDNCEWLDWATHRKWHNMERNK